MLQLLCYTTKIAKGCQQAPSQKFNAKVQLICQKNFCSAKVHQVVSRHETEDAITLSL